MLPLPFVERMRDLLGSEADDFLATYDDPPVSGLRANSLKLRDRSLAALSPWPLTPVPWCPSGYFLPPDGRPGKHPYHAAGLYYLQEPSAMAVVEALDVRPGQRVVDLAAAPGGKTTHIVSKLGGTGLLVANEIERSRVKALGENLERWGATNVVLTNETPERLANHFGALFDRVLLDAPCSGEGMFRKSAIARAEWSVAHVAGCAVRQARILDDAARLVVAGGLLVYSTCTFAPEEDEQRIAVFLAEHPDWWLEEIPKEHNIAPGRPDWVGSAALPALSRTARLWPHRLHGEGHFIALLRNGSASEAVNMAGAIDTDTSPHRRATGRAAQTAVERAGVEVIAALHTFVRDVLLAPFPDERMRVSGDQVALLPDHMMSFGNLHIVRAGLWLGTARPGRFEPSHALALALSADHVRNVVDLALNEAGQYMRGATLPIAGPEGWVLISVDGWPLGWGRRVGGTIKNFYPKGLRWTA